jgi:hypothetical protein
MNQKGTTTIKFNHVVRSIHPTRGLLFGTLILGALLAFELFNYSTTDFALTDLMGDLRFLDVRWATILALAFCGIDFAGIARLFTPERGAGQPREIWYLFGAWLLAATMNAMLTWWGVAIAILNHASLGSSFVPSKTLVSVVPIFVAIMVWVIRVLIIGSFSIAGPRIFSQAELAYQTPQPAQSYPVPAPAVPATPVRTLIQPDSRPNSQTPNRNEPSYHPASMSSSPHNSHEVRK